MNKATTVDGFDAALATFVQRCQAQINEHWRYNHEACKLSVDTGGRKYIRIVRTSDGGRGQRGVYCFVERSTGNVLKAASWKAPAKHARGTILDPSAYGVTANGARYL